MYEWEGQDVAAVEKLLASRDPRRHRLLLVSCSPWPDQGDPSGTRLSWFADKGELSQFLWRVEPARHGLAPFQLVQLKDRVQTVITALDVTGPSEALQTQYNELAAPALGVLWWGRLEALKGDRDAWPAAQRNLYLGTQGADPPPLDNRETAAFVAFLQRRYSV